MLRPPARCSTSGFLISSGGPQLFSVVALPPELRLERHQLLEHLRPLRLPGPRRLNFKFARPRPNTCRKPLHKNAECAKREHGRKVDVLVTVTAVAAIAIATEACRQLRLRIPPDCRTRIVLSRPERRSCAERAAQARSGCYPGAQGITWFGAAPWARTVASHATTASYRDRGAVHRMEERPGTHELQSRTLCTLHHRGAGVAQQIDVGGGGGLLLLQ